MTFYLTFPNKPGWVTIWAPSYDDARVFAARNYLGAGEVNAFAVEPAGGGYRREDPA